MNVRPLSDRVIVQRSAAEDKTSGGILLPDAAQSKQARGKVISVGPGKLLKDGTRRGLQVKAGDTVLFTSWAGDEFKNRGQADILIMSEEDILAVLEA
jgi:chaperonin GroES